MCRYYKKVLRNLPILASSHFKRRTFLEYQHIARFIKGGIPGETLIPWEGGGGNCPVQSTFKLFRFDPDIETELIGVQLFH